MNKKVFYGKDYGNDELWNQYENHWAEILHEINKIFKRNKKFAAHLEKVKKEKEDGSAG